MTTENDVFVINLTDLIREIGEDAANAFLSSFSCALNQDIERFLKEKAIEFSKQRIAMTHLVVKVVNEFPLIIGYFALTNKSIIIDGTIQTNEKFKLSNTIWKKLRRYSTYDSDLDRYTVPIILIAQFGKNYTGEADKLIKGSDLMALAIEKIQEVQDNIGGAFTYIECEDKKELLDFYNKNGFVEFGKRDLDSDETDFSGTYLIQMLKHIKF